MPKNKKKQAKQKDADAITSSEIPQQRATKTHVNYNDRPSTATHNIHDRQPLPPIPEGEDVTDECPSPPTKID